MKSLPNITFKIPSSTDYLFFLREVVSSLNLTEEARRHLNISLVEAVDNAIFHAHHKDLDKEVEIKITNSAKKVIIEVKDEGKGFNIEKVPMPSIDQIDGRGVFIIKSLMNSVVYKNNRLRMVYEKSK